MSLLDTLAGTEAVTTPVVASPTAASHRVSVIPYNASRDPEADAFLSWLWRRMKADGLTDLYFPGQVETGYTSLVEMFSKPTGAALFKLDDTESDQWNDRIPGFITWSIQQFGNAPVLIAGFIFFREFWDHKTTSDAGAAAFKFWFEDHAAAQVQEVLGLCPSLHVVAQRYNKRVGLRERMRLSGCALFHNEPCDAIVYGMSRSEWLSRQERA